MAAAISYIGALIACSVATPGTIDSSGFGALTWTTIGKVVSWGQVGDTSNSIDIELLSGRVEHVNGVIDGGEIPWTVRFDVDAGQTLLVNNSNNNADVSFRITDPDGKLAYFFGRVANVQDQERNSTNFKALSGVIRVNSATVRV